MASADAKTVDTEEDAEDADDAEAGPGMVDGHNRNEFGRGCLQAVHTTLSLTFNNVHVLHCQEELLFLRFLQTKQTSPSLFLNVQVRQSHEVDEAMFFTGCCTIEALFCRWT